ncbi:DNA topoisomerase III [Prevotella sp. HMSC069G02]|nr:DNA topoisomerase III [Prevotella sp. HMSC069G02]
MIVCIAEKPSVAKDIARILGATTAKDGYMEGNGYQVTWTFGHLCELKEPNDYSENWKHWSLAALPMIPLRFGIKLIPDDGIKKQFSTIEKLYAGADEIINCGDAGQEGELIQRWVMQKANVKCPVKRLWISSMTDEAIQQGFQNLKDQQQYQPLYMAGLSRAIGDWLLGMNATRLYTLKYGQNKQVLSIGRVQTPTLALIVNRQKEIDHFKPEPYWVLATIYRDTQFTATSGKFTSKEEGEKAFATIDGKPFTIKSVQKKKGTEAPPHLYDLTSLQVDCNRKFSYSAETTLNLIQSLYEKKFTTYPRVDTQYLSDDIYPKCPQILNGLSQCKIDSQPKYMPWIKNLAAMSKKLPKSKKVFDTSKVTDHHAIIPTGVPVKSLTVMEQNVFDLIATRFISAFYPDCKFSTTTVLGEVDGIEFKVTGKEILEPGWRSLITPYSQPDSLSPDPSPKREGSDAFSTITTPQEIAPTTPLPFRGGVGEEASGGETADLPTFTKGESGPHTPTLTEKQTTPPKFYTEASLLRAMETAGKFVEDDELRAALKENGIGRPSSRAGIIETLFKRKYIRRERKNLVATPTGIELIDMIHEKLLTSCELTGIWEKKLRDIEHQKYDASQFIEELKTQISNIVNDVLRDNSNRRVTILSDEDLKKKTKKKAAPKSTEKKVSKKDKPLKPSDELIGKPCPLCGKGRIIKGKTAYGCSCWKDGCKFVLPFNDKV